MIRLKKNLVVCLTPELSEWLDRKEREGYKKTTFMRHVIERYMKAEAEGRTSLMKAMHEFWEDKKGYWVK